MHPAGLADSEETPLHFLRECDGQRCPKSWDNPDSELFSGFGAKKVAAGNLRKKTLIMKISGLITILLFLIQMIEQCNSKSFLT